MLRRVGLILIGSLIFFNVTFCNTQDESDEYFENMITIKVGRYLKQEFYEVISNFDGDIYIEIIDFLELTELTEYTELTIDNEIINFHMEGFIFFDNQERSIQVNKNKLDIVEINGKIYIKKENLNKLLPLNKIEWVEEKYTLKIYPKFRIPIEYRIASERRKKIVEKDKNHKKNVQEVDMFMKEERSFLDFGMLKIRYNIDDIGNFYKKGEQKDRGDMELEYSSQLFYGDFNIRQNLYSTRKLEEINLKYPYLFKNKTVTLGDTYISGNDILGYNRKIRGISIDNNDYSIIHSGKEVTIQGKTEQNSIVEIYQNGKVVDYQNVDGNSYEFTLKMRSQSDEFKIKIYDRNGVLIEEKTISVMEGNNFLTKGKWDYNFFYGQNPDSKNTVYDNIKYGISYGITNNLTYAFDYYNTSNEKKLYKYGKHRLGYRFSNLPVPLLMNFSYYDPFEDKSKSYITEVNTKLFSYKLYYTYKYYSNVLAADKGKESYHEVEISRDYGRFEYFIRALREVYMDTSKEKYDLGLSYDITKNVKVNLDFGKILKNNNERTSNYTREIEIDYQQKGFYYSVNVGYDDGRDSKLRYTGKIRKRMKKNTKYSYNMEIAYNENDVLTFGVGFQYKFNDFFKIGYDYDSGQNDQHKIRGSFEKVIDLKNPLTTNKAKTPSNGYLEGTIFIDKNGNGKKEIDEIPLEGIRAGVGKNMVKTNKNGVFYLSNIYPYRKNKLVYDYSGTMIDPTLRADASQELAIIPASGRKINVGLTPLSMIMGSIYLPDIDTKKRNKFFSYVEITIEKDGGYYDSIKPEYDGFFVVQDLKPGKYLLEINYLGNEKISFEKNKNEVIITSGETGNFYDGIDFKVSEVKNKNEQIK